MRNQAALKCLDEEASDGFAAAFAVIQRPMVDIHTDEFIRKITAHVAGVLKRMLNRFLPMIEAVLDAGGKDT